MAPCMDNWLRLDDPVQVKSHSTVLKRLTDPANFESFLFMPVTRDMTAGERALLWNFLDAPEEPEALTTTPTDEEAPPQTRADATPPHPDLAQLSRAMRSG